MAQTQVFRGTARKIVQFGDSTVFMYHNTDVVTVSSSGRVTLDSGGYRTNTTKLAMNQVSNQFAYGFNVFQERGEWFVRLHGGELREFVDGMTFTVAEARARAA